jgi:hypothetical protein
MPLIVILTLRLALDMGSASFGRDESRGLLTEFEDQNPIWRLVFLLPVRETDPLTQEIFNPEHSNCKFAVATAIFSAYIRFTTFQLFARFSALLIALG